MLVPRSDSLMVCQTEQMANPDDQPAPSQRHSLPHNIETPPPPQQTGSVNSPPPADPAGPTPAAPGSPPLWPQVKLVTITAAITAVLTLITTSLTPRMTRLFENEPPAARVTVTGEDPTNGQDGDYLLRSRLPGDQFPADGKRDPIKWVLQHGGLPVLNDFGVLIDNQQDTEVQILGIEAIVDRREPVKWVALYHEGLTGGPSPVAIGFNLDKDRSVGVLSLGEEPGLNEAHDGDDPFDHPIGNFVPKKSSLTLLIRPTAKRAGLIEWHIRLHLRLNDDAGERHDRWVEIRPSAKRNYQHAVGSPSTLTTAYIATFRNDGAVEVRDWATAFDRD